MQVMDLWKEVLVTALGSLAFGIVYKVKKNRLFAVAAGGGIGWMIYRLLLTVTENIFFSNLGATMFAMAFSEMMARWRKAPVVVFLLPCLIPLVPGGSLYYAMSWIVRRDMPQALTYLGGACEAALGIAAGIILVSVAIHWNRSTLS